MGKKEARKIPQDYSPMDVRHDGRFGKQADTSL
jgi:hypothetical protein